MILCGVGINRPGAGLGLEQLVKGQWRPFRLPNFDSQTLNVNALFLDRTGCLWVGTSENGIYRIHGHDVDHFDSRDGLSGDSINIIFRGQGG